MRIVTMKSGPVDSSDPPVPRALTEEERALLRWLLSRGGEAGQALLPQVEHARVVGGCGCGCATLDLEVDGRPPAPPGIEMVSPDFFWTEPSGGLCGIFVHGKQGTLSGLEVWSVDGETTPTKLPSIDQLHPGLDLPPPS